MIKRIPPIVLIFFFGSGIFWASIAEGLHFFSGDSIWYEKVPENPKIKSGSENYIDDITFNSNTIGVSYREWSIPVWRAKKETPYLKVNTINRHSSSFGWDIVPIPGDAVPAGNSQSVKGKYRDGHMVVISHDEKYEWDFFNAVKHPDGTWSAYTIRKWDLLGNGINSPYDLLGSARACPAPLTQGLITMDEIIKGHIDHAIAFSYWGEKKSYHTGVYPCEAGREGVSERKWAMQLGYRLQLSPEVNCDKLKLNRMGKIICRAMQEYGMIFVMNSGKGYNNIYAESIDGKPNAWEGIVGDLDAIPLHELRVIEMDREGLKN